MTRDTRPIVGISMGDPAGIGPEIVAKALAREEVHRLCRPLVIGDAAVMRRAAKVADVSLPIRTVPSDSLSPVLRGEGWGEGRRVNDATRANPSPPPSPQRTGERENEAHAIDVYDLHTVDLSRLELGKVSAAAGHAAFEAVRTMIDLAMSGAIGATVTAPIHKEALALAGHHFPGHTEIFAKHTNTADFTMMLAAGKLRVVHVSTHVSLRQACDAVTRDRVLKVIQLGHRACRQLGIANPKIGVAGLNPHASDGGLFGTEEREHITPAIEAARAAGMDVEGPQPPDTFFPKAVAGAYDLCVAMYHDQGHIPVKCQGFKYDAAERKWTSVHGINVSLGLPIIRTSVDHGTAFDQAGKGTASDESMVEAIAYAARLAGDRK